MAKVKKDILKGYLGNHLLKRKDTPIQWTPELVREYERCRDDIEYFAEKYIHIVHVDRGLIKIPLYDYQREILQKFSKQRNLAVNTSRQAGKALSLDTKIPKADGSWTTMGALEVGDVIIGADGNPTRVQFKSEIHNKPTYRIQFGGEGAIVEACEDHLWYVFDRIKKKYRTLSTKQLVNSYKRDNNRGYTEYRFCVVNTKPIEYSEKQLAIDPYILGAWLGDGGTNTASFTCSIKHVQHFIDRGLTFNSLLSYERNQNTTVFTNTIKGLLPLLREEGVLGNKHIPVRYLTGSQEQRIRLLQGLMDTDGFVEKNGTCQIQLSCKTEQLIEDIGVLLNSLGFKWTKSYFKQTDSIRISFSTSKEHIVPVTIKHKLDRIKDFLARERYVFSRSIVDIKQIENKPTQCIQVDNKDHLFLFGNNFIPTHNTTVATIVIIHYALFNDFKRIGLLSNKGDSAREILDRIQIAYQHLPLWLQQGVVEWNKGSVELENGSKIVAAATSSSAIRGKSMSLLYIDETAHVEGWVEFSKSVLPTISSGKTTKLLYTSTPNGLNHFYYTCRSAKEHHNGFGYVEVPWWKIPGRDEEWKKKALEELNYDENAFQQEYCCEFLGSSGTLINGTALKSLVKSSPIHDQEGLKIYKKPSPKSVYCMICDVSRGRGLDYSAFSVIDITKMPYEQVAVFRDNMTSPVEYCEIIHRTGINYNNAFAMIEINDIGGQVADLLWMDYEYENIITTQNNGRNGKSVSSGFGKSVDMGIRTTKNVKSIGCSLLKLLVEQQQLVVVDEDTIGEMTTFSKKGNSYEAEPGKNDDLVMGLVLFGWLTSQQYFKDITDINTLTRLREKSEDQLLNEVLPFGFIHNANPAVEEEIIHVDRGDNAWLM